MVHVQKAKTQVFPNILPKNLKYMTPGRYSWNYWYTTSKNKLYYFQGYKITIWGTQALYAHATLWSYSLLVVEEIDCWLGLASSGFLMTHDSRLTVGQPVIIDGTASTFFQVDVCSLIVQDSKLSLANWEATLSSVRNIGLGCSVIPCMDGVPVAFSSGWMMLLSLDRYCYNSRFWLHYSPCLWILRV